MASWVLAEFRDEAALCAAARRLRELGHRRLDAYSPISLRAPPSLLARAAQPDGWYFQVMSEGFGLMPSYASVIPVEERWAIVAYIRALQISQTARAADLAPADRAKLDGEGR